MYEQALHVLLTRRGQAPFKGMWAIPGGFKLPPETLDGAAGRELAAQTLICWSPGLIRRAHVRSRWCRSTPA